MPKVTLYLPSCKSRCRSFSSRAVRAQLWRARRIMPHSGSLCRFADPNRNLWTRNRLSEQGNCEGRCVPSTGKNPLVICRALPARVSSKISGRMYMLPIHWWRGVPFSVLKRLSHGVDLSFGDISSCSRSTSEILPIRYYYDRNLQETTMFLPWPLGLMGCLPSSIRIIKNYSFAIHQSRTIFIKCVDEARYGAFPLG
jgi:hypothetical protein